MKVAKHSDLMRGLLRAKSFVTVAKYVKMDSEFHSLRSAKDADRGDSYNARNLFMNEFHKSLGTDASNWKYKNLPHKHGLARQLKLSRTDWLKIQIAAQENKKPESEIIRWLVTNGLPALEAQKYQMQFVPLSYENMQ